MEQGFLLLFFKKEALARLGKDLNPASHGSDVFSTENQWFSAVSAGRLVTQLQAIGVSISKRQVMRLLIDGQDDST
jgi:hypothetical protein